MIYAGVIIESRNFPHLKQEQMRLALEEKMREMWQPEEVLNRIATFVDSNFQDIGNDEFSSALGNIKARSEELKQLSIKKATDVVKNKIKKPTDNSKEVEAQLKHEFNQRVSFFTLYFR